MNDYKDYCKKYVEYIGGDINSNEYKSYLTDPFPAQLWKDKAKENEKLKDILFKIYNDKIDVHCNEFYREIEDLMPERFNKDVISFMNYFVEAQEDLDV